MKKQGDPKRSLLPRPPSECSSGIFPTALAPDLCTPPS